MNADPSFPTDQIKTWTPGTAFKFTVGGNVTNLKVEEIQSHMMTAVVVGGPRDGQKMVWNLESIPQIHGISQ